MNLTCSKVSVGHKGMFYVADADTIGKISGIRR